MPSATRTGPTISRLPEPTAPFRMEGYDIRVTTDYSTTNKCRMAFSSSPDPSCQLEMKYDLFDPARM
ncbi:hypothetical protein NDU88_003643 [Pleurodeles waltl]|uniref:Uncharacterized protein n=1 Tax=Pleurodeles waltl TaxID=8319 RepID=A0AAV7T5W7_PLEWA|nr:hypothetical protein NDU88_003643 [Pleurodeles waltl]